MRLDGKIAVVTGGLSGIGAAIAQRMVSEGATVIAADRSTDKTTLDCGAILPLHVDVQDPVSVDLMVGTVVAIHGRLDCMVNSAGIGVDIPFLQTSLDTFDRTVAVNLRGTFIVGQAAARTMKETGGGSIVNVASVSGIMGNAGRSAYGASKWGVVGLSRVMAIDLAAFGIRVNVLAPGAVKTPLVDLMLPGEEASEWTAHTPLHRFASRRSCWFCRVPLFWRCQLYYRTRPCCRRGILGRRSHRAGRQQRNDKAAQQVL